MSHSVDALGKEKPGETLLLSFSNSVSSLCPKEITECMQLNADTKKEVALRNTNVSIDRGIFK